MENKNNTGQEVRDGYLRAPQWLIWNLQKCWYSFIASSIKVVPYVSSPESNGTTTHVQASTVQHVEKRKIAQNEKESKEKHDEKHEKSKLISLYLRATLRASTCAPSTP